MLFRSINGAIAEGLEALDPRIQATAINLDMAEQGCAEALLAEADVLFWLGHARHHEVTEETARRVFTNVHERGMCLVALHSAHYSKI